MEVPPGSEASPPDADNKEPLPDEAGQAPERPVAADALPVPGGAEPAAASAPVPSLDQAGATRLFGKYRLLRDLGAGGMAQIYLAAIDGPGGFEKQCVVKKILPEHAKNPNFAQMFIHEAKVAAMMSHQNIVQVFEFALEGENYFLAMEYVSGSALGRLMRAARKLGSALGPQVAVDVGLGIGHALEYAHAMQAADGTPMGIVHRDVSPENILVSRDGAVKLTDFGVVKSSMNAEATVAGVVKGKWAYMSPEQVTNQRVDGRSDLFSLGIVMYEACVGRRLFRGDSVAATVTALTSGTITPPSALVPDVPAGLDAIIMKALERSPARRYQSATELLHDLEAFRANQGWQPARRKLSELVNTLFPRDGSAPKSSITTLSMPGGAQAPSQNDEEELPLVSDSVKLMEPTPAGPSAALLVAIGLAAVLGSALVWVLLLLLDRPPS